MSVNGFEVPIHRSLTQQIMLAGVPREIAILNGTTVAAFGLGLHSYWSIPVGIVLLRQESLVRGEGGTDAF